MIHYPSIHISMSLNICWIFTTWSNAQLLGPCFSVSQPHTACFLKDEKVTYIWNFVEWVGENWLKNKLTHTPSKNKFSYSLEDDHWFWRHKIGLILFLFIYEKYIILYLYMYINAYTYGYLDKESNSHLSLILILLQQVYFNYYSAVLKPIMLLSNII